jgi:hypothetical protein
MGLLMVGTPACVGLAISMVAGCTASESTLRCGAGTTLDGHDCVAPPRFGSTGVAADACGAGTYRSGDFCVPEGVTVASTEPCAAGKKVMHFDGHDFVYTGMLTVTVADWLDLSDRKSIYFIIQIGDPLRGLQWNLTFDADRVNYDLVPGVYDMADRARVGSPGHPGIDIAGEGRACSEPTGRFQIHEIEQHGDGKLAHLLLSFEQLCSRNATQPLAGCVRYEP